MAIFASLFALVGRFVGRILTTTLGWASTLLFGQVPQSRQVWLAVLTFGSLVWVALAAGVVLPSIGTFLLGFVPVPGWISQEFVRLVMLAAAVALPPVLGAVTLLVTDAADRPRGRALVGTVLRGYPLAPALALTLVLLALVGTARRLDAAVHRRESAHVAMIVRPGRYEALVAATRASLQAEQLVTRRRPGSRLLTVPAQLLARIAGGGMERLVPDELAELVGPSLVAAVYPSDLALTGSKASVAEARALVLRDVDSTEAWFTTSKEAQRLEDRMSAMAKARLIDRRALGALDDDLLRLVVPEEEWEVLYRRRLQLVAGGDTDIGGGQPGDVRREVQPARRAPGEWTPGTWVGAAGAVLVLLDIVLLLTGFGRPRLVSWRSRSDGPAA